MCTAGAASKRTRLAEIFRKEIKDFYKMSRKGVMDHKDPESVKTHFDFGGEILVGHLRYGTSGEFDEGSCHPVPAAQQLADAHAHGDGQLQHDQRRANSTRCSSTAASIRCSAPTPRRCWRKSAIISTRPTPISTASSATQGVPGAEMPEKISAALDVPRLVAESAAAWDGGYAICGVIGNGDMFVMRDPRGIRPCHMLVTDEVIAFASERVPLMTVFEAEADDVKAVDPGSMITIKADGSMSDTAFAAPQRLHARVRSRKSISPAATTRRSIASARRWGRRWSRRSSSRSTAHLTKPSSRSSPTPPKPPTTA